MKGSHILITLLSMSILCGVHASHGSDAPNRGIMQTITDSTVGQYLRACGSYIEQTPELRWRKLGLASSLLAPWVASFFSEKPYGLLKSLIPMYPAYQIAKDISVVRDIQLAQAGKKIPNERIKEYMHAVIDIDNRPIGFDSSNRRQFEDRNTRMFLMWSVIKEYKQHSQKKDQLQKCAQEVLASKGFEYPNELVNRTWYEIDQITAQRNRGIAKQLHQKWHIPVGMLAKILDNTSTDFASYDTSSSFLDYKNPERLERHVQELGFQTATFNYEAQLDGLIEKAKNGKEINDKTIKLCISSLLSYEPTDHQDDQEEGDYYHITFKPNGWNNGDLCYDEPRGKLKLKHRELLANYYTNNAEQIQTCAHQVLSNLQLIKTAGDRTYINIENTWYAKQLYQRAADDLFKNNRLFLYNPILCNRLFNINILLHALVGDQLVNSPKNKKCIYMKDNFSEIDITKNSSIYNNIRYRKTEYDVTHLFEGFKQSPGEGCLTKRANKTINASQ